MSPQAHKRKRAEAGGTAVTATAVPVSHVIGGTSDDPTKTMVSREDYESQLHRLQIELVKLQRHTIRCGDRVLVLLEGRDAAGKDGCIKRIGAHLSLRETRVVALGKPSDRDRCGWYFKRYVAHLPVAEELVLFNRSWYNRAGVERVMGWSSCARCRCSSTCWSTRASSC